MRLSAETVTPQLLIINEDLTLVPMDDDRNWYRVERLVHEQITRTDEFIDEEGHRYGKWYNSARLDPYTCYEGSPAQMLEMLSVLTGEIPIAREKRISVQRFPYDEYHCYGFIMESPRNSNEVYSYLSMEVADKLVDRMLSVLLDCPHLSDEDREYLKELKEEREEDYE